MNYTVVFDPGLSNSITTTQRYLDVSNKIHGSYYYQVTPNNTGSYERGCINIINCNFGAGYTPPANTTTLPNLNNLFQVNPNMTFLQNSGKDNHIAVSNDACRKQDSDPAKNATDEKNLADPVTLATGEFTYDNTLMSTPGVGLPYHLQINYKN